MNPQAIRFLTITALILSINSLSASIPDSLLNRLDYHIGIRKQFMEQKNQRTNSIKAQISSTRSDTELYALYDSLISEYEYYNFDMAADYALKQSRLAYKKLNKNEQNLSRLRWGRLLTIKGLYKESEDSLLHVNQNLLNYEDRLQYYEYMLALYMELIQFSSDKLYSPMYRALSINYCDSLILNTDEKDFRHFKYSGVQQDLEGNNIAARKEFINVLRSFPISDHEFARVSASLGDLYMRDGIEIEAINCFAGSAIADLRNNIKETTALRKLAEQFYKQGEIDLAYKYILISKENADFYGTNQRKMQVGMIFPQIEGDHLHLIDQKRKQFLWSWGITVLLLLAILGFTFSIFLQYRKLRNARHEIQEAYNYLHEANTIKIQYIGYYFSISTRFIERLDKLKQRINHSLIQNDIEKINKLVRDIKPKKEREQLLHNFDEIFLSIFPDFINKYNELFKEEEKQKNTETNQLTTPQRIFALIRIGVKENEKIANILNLSINTVYTYKTREKNRSLIPNDHFDEKIMEIKSV